MCKFKKSDKAIFVRNIYFDGVDVSKGDGGVTTRFYVEKDGKFCGFDDYDSYPVEAMFDVMYCTEGCLCVTSTRYGQRVREDRMLTEKEYEERFGHKFVEPVKPKKKRRLRLDFVTSVLRLAESEFWLHKTGNVELAYRQVIEFLEEHADEW